MTCSDIFAFHSMHDRFVLNRYFHSIGSKSLLPQYWQQIATSTVLAANRYFHSIGSKSLLPQYWQQIVTVTMMCSPFAVTDSCMFSNGSCILPHYHPSVTHYPR
jgi:hypothetical protein